jgi:uncharacterized membrane protein YhfC
MEAVMDTLVRLLNPALMIAMPLALGAGLIRRWRLPWRLLWLGAATFLGAQVLHLPFNRWVLQPLLESLGLRLGGGSAQLAAVALAAGLSAGLFEEPARYLVYRRWLRPPRSWRTAMVFGAGHGGVEAGLLGLLALYGAVQAVALRGADLSALVPAEQLPQVQAQLQAYWALPWHLVLLGAVERAATLALHLGLSVLVLQAVQGRGLWWLGAAVALHTLINAAGLFALQTWGPYWAEALIVLVGLATLAWGLALRTPEAPPQAPAILEPPQVPQELPAPPPRPDQLEDSRYV